MARLTPMMEQYFEIKNQHKDCLLFFRLGDFYELFYEDALVASKELEITLTGKECGQEERAPMCGVPYHSVDGYIARLVQKGYRVAICEQVEDPKATKTIVKREVVRIITPGTILDTHALDESRNNYIMCVYEDKNGYGLSVADVTTGEFLTSFFLKDEEKKVSDEIVKYNPAEIIVNEGFTNRDLYERTLGIPFTVYVSWAFYVSNAYKKLCDHFHVLNLSGYGLAEIGPEACASGALLTYLAETQMNSLSHITSIKKYATDKFMLLDASSRRNLELTETIREKSKKHTMLWVLDHTKTAMGARLLRKWIEQPLINAMDIRRRLDAVDDLRQDTLLREELKELLHTVYDIERIISRLVYGVANARDLVALKNSLLHFPHIKDLLKSFQSELFREMVSAFDTLDDIFELIDRAMVDNPPFGIREGGFVRDGYHAGLDEIRDAKNNGTEWLARMEANERELTGIKNLKIRYNKVFGYYIEISKSHIHLAPERYVRRQTLANCERYTHEDLKKIEDMILGADDKINTLEYDLFMELREKINSQIERIQLSTYIVSVADVLQSFGDVADKWNYAKPEVDDGDVVDIADGRHPVVEQMMDSFVPNDTYLDIKGNRLAIITGPNMAGKSTYMRQVALIVLMAQIGSFVPATSCRVGVVDRIFTRVGASDDLATGQSTFMVEMTEVANILNNATQNSLIILDEIGRGTSTFDGLSIAWSVLEYIADSKKLGAKTLFATHYHELSELEGKVRGVNNFCVTVREDGDDIVFLRKIARGGADNSYGIHVARLAGLPKDVLRRSQEILDALNHADIVKKSADADEKPDIVHYKKPRRKKGDDILTIEEEIINIDVDRLTPIEALDRIYRMKELIIGWAAQNE